MSKKIGNINLNNDTLKGLEGFEDVFEDYVESEEYKDLERRKGENTKIGEQHELQRFLEEENARLTGLEIFLTKKVPLKTNFSQSDKLIKMQIDRKNALREKLFGELKKLDSSLQKNLAQFFNSHFS